MLRGHGGIAVLWHGGIAVLCGGARSSMPRGIAVVCAVQVFRACVLEVYPLSNSSLRARRRLPWILSKCGVSLGKSTYIYIYICVYIHTYIYIYTVSLAQRLEVYPRPECRCCRTPWAGRATGELGDAPRCRRPLARPGFGGRPDDRPPVARSKYFCCILAATMP